MLDSITAQAGRLKVSNVSKRYFLAGMAGRIQNIFGQLADDKILWALKDVSFEVSPGEIYALVGRNGSGKSTMLKLLAGIMRPTRGSISCQGRLSCLIEVGAGFHPELTGRENIFLHGAISGMKRLEVAAKLDAIVDFAGIGRFLDMPVKNYSSGMFTRLGFAVSVHSSPGILLVDEVLAVGDQAFQSKCIKTLNKLQQQGCAIILVSHSMFTVANVCNRGMWLDLGVVRAEGGIEDVIKAYEGQQPSIFDDRPTINTQGSELLSVASANIGEFTANEIAHLQVGQPFEAFLEVESKEKIDDPVVGAAILRGAGEGLGELCGAWDSRAGRVSSPSLAGRTRYKIEIAPPKLLPGNYSLILKICDATQTVTLALATLRFTVDGPYPSLNPDFYGRFLLDQTWSMEQL